MFWFLFLLLKVLLLFCRRRHRRRCCSRRYSRLCCCCSRLCCCCSRLCCCCRWIWFICRVIGSVSDYTDWTYLLYCVLLFVVSDIPVVLSVLLVLLPCQQVLISLSTFFERNVTLPVTMFTICLGQNEDYPMLEQYTHITLSYLTICVYFCVVSFIYTIQITYT